jgi:hypothetical protein
MHPVGKEDQESEGEFHPFAFSFHLASSLNSLTNLPIFSGNTLTDT